nr:hypothetical protein BaRGS_015753 [Batillaria attramentaria]
MTYPYWLSSTQTLFLSDCAEGKASLHYPDIGKAGKQQRSLLARPRLSPRDIPVTCRTNGNTIFLQKSYLNSLGSFNLSWENYVSGMKVPGLEDDLFMGLQDLYYFTNSKPYKLSVRILLYDGTKIFFTYDNFLISDNTTFTLSVGNFKARSLEGFDLFSASNGQKFSTKDNDNDGNGDRNCAAEYGGGWWYNGCPDYNVMGWVVGEGETVAGDQYLHYGPLAAGTMKVFTLSLEN